ncbi:MAG: restriction endonuclease [Bacillota bacterium]
MINRLKQGKKLYMGFKRWKDLRDRGRYLKYYIKPAGNGRNLLSTNIDFYGLLAFALLSTYLALAVYTGSPLKATYYGIPLMIAEAYAAFRIRRALEKEANAHKRLWRAGRLCQEKIKSLGSSTNLEVLVMEVLEKLPGFSDVHVLKDEMELDDKNDSNISLGLRALYQGRPVLVGCIVPEEGKSISHENVSAFIEEVKRINIKEGIMVAGGIFTTEAKRAAREGKKRIILIDLYRLVEFCRQAGHVIFSPVQNDVNGDKVQKHSNVLRVFLRFAFSREKARGYLLSGLIMIVLYMTTLSSGILGIGYLFFGAINLALSLYCIVSNRELDLIG